MSDGYHLPSGEAYDSVTGLLENTNGIFGIFLFMQMLVK